MPQNPETNLNKSNITGVSKLNNEFPTFCPQSREEWRRWLDKNHRTSLGVWLIYYKVKSGKPSVLPIHEKPDTNKASKINP
jgi:uncharacterized protein YdeI (YjbR/CyaY-like superfamily)